MTRGQERNLCVVLLNYRCARAALCGHVQPSSVCRRPAIASKSFRRRLTRNGRVKIRACASVTFELSARRCIVPEKQWCEQEFGTGGGDVMNKNVLFSIFILYYYTNTKKKKKKMQSRRKFILLALTLNSSIIRSVDNGMTRRCMFINADPFNRDSAQSYFLNTFLNV
jgi:hypothetical protein